MNRIFKYFSILFLLYTGPIFGQDCFPNGLTITNQAQIDFFPFNFPNCSVIGGNLIIDEEVENGITNLLGLASITTIEGDLWLNQNNAIVTLQGLEGLTHIGGQLNIYNNINLMNVNGLENLQRIDGQLSITANNSMTQIDAFNKLSDLGQLFLFANDAMETLTGFENITAIPGDFWIDNMDILESVHAFQNLDTVYGDFILELNSEINDLSGFQNLKYIGKSFDVHGHDSLLDLTGFSSLNHIGERVLMTENNALTDLTGLGALTYVGEDFWVWFQDAMTSFNGLDNLDTINGDLAVNNLHAITSLQGLENLKYLGMDLEITNNDLIQNLEGLILLDSIRQKLDIKNNPLLENLSGLEKFNGVGGLVNIENNQSLQSVEGLMGIKYIGEYLRFDDNHRLTSLDGLEALQYINGHLEINNCDSLDHVRALENLDSLSGHLTITNNHLLTGLAGLHNLDPFSIESNSMTYPDLNIVNNFSLSKCAVISICAAFDRVDLDYDVRDNLAACNSKPAITDECNCQQNLLIALERDTLCPGGSTLMSLVNIDDPSLEFEWTPTQGLDDPTLQNPTATPDFSTIYSVTIIDPTKGCSQQASITIIVSNTSIEPITFVGEQSLCVGDSSILSVDTAYENYIWSTGSEDPNITIYNANSYELTVTDTNGCTTSSEISISSLESPTVTINALGAPNFCEGDSVFLNVEDSYNSYLWSSNEDIATISVKEEGTYTVTVTNAMGCPASSSIDVIVYPSPILQITVEHESALGQKDGKATADTSSGQEPFTYDWSTGESTPEIENLSPDDYSVTLSDARGCTDVQTFTIDAFECNVLAYQINQNDVTCFDACDGSISIEDIANGTPPYSLEWENNGSVDSLFSLCADTYFLTITDASNCTTEEEITLVQPDVQTVVIDSVTEASGTTGGAIHITASGDNSYLWTGPSDYISTNEDITNLNEGCYTVVITDNQTSCTIDTTICVLLSGLNELADKASIQLFPNPSTGILQWKVMNGATIDYIEITAINGASLGRYNAAGNSIDLSSIQPGAYIIKMQIAEGSVYRRWVKL